MKKYIVPLIVVSMSAALLTACKKDIKAPPEPQADISPAILEKIEKLGFQTAGAQKVAEGYVVENDILLGEEDLGGLPTTHEIIYAQEEHYRTTRLVNPAKFPVVKVALWVRPPFECADAFSRALDEAIRRYNAQALTIKFQRVANAAQINVYGFWNQSPLAPLAFAGFPTAHGAPFSSVNMNIPKFLTTTHSTNVNYIATIMAHEIGHCIGFRHTDFMNRAYSCGGFPVNEGQAGIGAIHIPGTPVGPSANSWMLACIGNLQNRIFTPADKIALNTVY